MAVTFFVWLALLMSGLIALGDFIIDQLPECENKVDWAGNTFRECR
jgi:hypothetical protein